MKLGDQIRRDQSAGGDTGLNMITCLHLVDVVGGFPVPPENSFSHQACHVFTAFGIDLRRTAIGTRWQVDLWLGNMQEAVGPSRR